MSRYLFCALFLLLVCSTSSALAHKANSEESDLTAVQNVELFKEDCKVQLDTNGGETASYQNKIKNVDNLFFVTVGDLLVAVAEANYTEINRSDTKVDFVAAYPKKIEDWDKEIFKEKNGDICEKWNTQFATKNTNANSFSLLKNVVYDNKNKKIYLLAVKQALTDNKWEYNLFVGNASKSEEGEFIMWDETKKTLKITKISNKEKDFEDKLKDNFVQTSSIDNSAFVINNQKIVFVLRATNNQNDNKNVIALVELKIDDGKSDLLLEFLHVNETSKNCYPYFFSWGGKIVMIPTNCDLGGEAYQNVKESSDMKVWKESSGPFYYSSEFLKDKTSFTTAVINGTNVLLFAQKKNGEEGCTDKKCFTFWFSDGNRTYNVGQTILEDDGDVVSSSIIYVKEALYLFLHQQSDSSNNKKFTLTPLDNQLKNITATLKKWRSAHQNVLDLCKTERSDSQSTCVASLPTEGLLGFLSGKESTNKWEDKYLYVNADIIGGATFQNGLICNGAGQGAKWPVDQGNENKAYNLKDPGFTLVAPVKISGNANQTNSILGVGLTGVTSGSGQKSIGLWCSDKGKWAVGKGEEEPTNLVPTNENCEQGETYLVVLMFKKKESKLEVHIDGKKLEISQTETMKIEDRETISYFYFGAGSKQNSVETHVTLKYVLLYNRPLDGNENNKLKAPRNEKVTNPEKSDGGNNTLGQQKDDTTKNNKGVNKEESSGTEETQTSTTTTEDSAARVGVVGVLCFMLFGVFTLLGRYVY